MCTVIFQKGILQCTSDFRLCPPPPPRKKKKTRSLVLGSRRSFAFQTETLDTKCIIFSFILDFPFLFAVRISLLLFLHMKYTQITLSRREKGRQVKSNEELKGTPPLFLLFLYEKRAPLKTPAWEATPLSACMSPVHVEISLPVSR